MKNKLMLSLVLLLFAMSYGCKKDLGTLPDKIDKTEKIGRISAYNPYSVENMRKALSNLIMKDVQLLANNKQKYAHGTLLATSSSEALVINKNLTLKESVTLVNNSIEATHYYIKFMPANEAEYSKLKMDSNLIIYPFPLDVAVSKYSGNYRDPSVPKGVPTYQYASVPVNYILPNVPYTKLEDLYLPDESSKGTKVTIKGGGGSSYSISGRELVNQSICDEEPEIPDYSRVLPPPEDCEEDYGGGGPSTGTGAPAGEWRPSGRITMYDEVLGQTIGINGMKVRARRWFTTYTGITDANGYYHVDGTFTRPANYWLNFERYDFAIVSEAELNSLEISGPKQEAPWNRDLTGYDKYYATIFRAAFHYYYKDIQGLRRPPQSSFWERQVKIEAINRDEAPSGYTNPVHTWFGVNDLVEISTFERTSEYTYATTIHELAHASHWDESNWSFTMSTPTVSESMAAGIEWFLTRMEYPNFKGYQWPQGGNYRNVIIDLIDTSSDISYQTNPGSFNNFGFASPSDQVEGYNIVDIQNAMIHNATTWNEWKANIKNNYNNATENNLDALFEAWYNY